MNYTICKFTCTCSAGWMDAAALWIVDEMVPNTLLSNDYLNSEFLMNHQMAYSNSDAFVEKAM